MSQVTLSGYIVVPDEELAVVSAALVEHIALTRAEAGCLTFEVEATPDDPCRFTVHEVFVDRQAFDLHQQRVKASHWGEVTGNVSRHYEIREG